MAALITMTTRIAREQVPLGRELIRRLREAAFAAAAERLVVAARETRPSGEELLERARRPDLALRRDGGAP